MNFVMGPVEDARFELVVRCSIVDRLRTGTVEGIHGTIYIAHGLNADRTIVGVWGHRGVARVLEFAPDDTPKMVQQALVNDAAEYAQDLVEKDLIDAGNGRTTPQTIQ
jgi:hypothetical protein